MTAVYVCECEHPKSQHKRERAGCRALDCGCSQFEADMAASAVAQAVERLRVEAAVLPVLEAEAAKSRASLEAAIDEALDRPTVAEIVAAAPPPDTLSTSTRLAKAERERDEALAKARDAEHSRKAAAERHRIEWGMERDASVKLRHERALARAELVSARQETEQLRAELKRLRVDRVGRLIYAYDAWACLACGSRYHAAYTDHEHGPLTAVTVTIARTEGPTE